MLVPPSPGQKTGQVKSGDREGSRRIILYQELQNSAWGMVMSNRTVVWFQGRRKLCGQKGSEARKRLGTNPDQRFPGDMQE